MTDLFFFSQNIPLNRPDGLCSYLVLYDYHTNPNEATINKHSNFRF